MERYFLNIDTMEVLPESEWYYGNITDYAEYEESHHLALVEVYWDGWGWQEI